MTDTAGRNQPVMPPGRELDALVAEKVMGWKRLGDASPHSRWRGLEWVKPDGSLSVTLTFSVEWDAMRLVVERMVAQGFWLSINANVSGQYWCVVYPKHGAPIETDYGDTAPHAVCLAALTALKAATSAQQGAEASRE